MKLRNFVIFVLNFMPRLLLLRRQELILGYIIKKVNGKQNSCSKRLPRINNLYDYNRKKKIKI